ncbi:hypothetical protein [Bordetella genomosp. 6]|uniref:Uncharacterized protein n=1 Tax=Bordetella genomosp. 6 TaxID=463024 RepID=A0ABX4FDY8_9BORD|nr:hypothetical protein [Bordetella genomosp. 6]OZI80421.1 hypothetical protein CAL23_01440 [Bordetella genomosp. 6]
MKSVTPRMQHARIGQQLLPHFAQRAELRRTIPLFPFTLAELLAPLRRKTPGKPGSDEPALDAR